MDADAKDATDSAGTVDAADAVVDAITADAASATTAACGSSFFSAAAAALAMVAVMVAATAVDVDARQLTFSCIGLKRRSHFPVSFSYIFITLIPEGVTMAGKPSKPMTPFDKSVTPSYLYKWKLFLAFLPPSIQRFLAVYIKFTEFRYTMDYFRGLPFHAFSFQSLSNLRLIWMKMNGI